MTAAEKWYEYQETDQKYGQGRVVRSPQRKKPSRKVSISPKDKAKLLMLTLLAGMLCIGLIIATAYAASVKYGINQTIKANAALEAEIEMLNVKIYSTNNIEAIEEKAIKELGMAYPKDKQIVYLDAKQKPGAEFAEKLKRQAYNKEGKNINKKKE